MKCSCPKCHAHIELDLHEVPEEGVSAACPECKARFTVSRESFGGRALRRTGEITCASCGTLLGPHLHCPSCGILYPDYLVATVGRKKIRTMKKVQLKTSPFPKREARRVELPTLNALPDTTAKPAAKKVGKAPKLTPQVIIAVVLLLALTAGGAAAYLHRKGESEFTSNFILAAYGTKIGERKGLAVCNKLAADWKAKSDAGQTVTPRTAVSDMNQLAAGKVQVDAMMAKLDRNKVPKTLASSMDKLDNLYAAYDRTRNLAGSPSPTLSAYTAAIAKVESDYNAAAKELKGSLPAPVLDKMRTAAKRNKGFQGLFD